MSLMLAHWMDSKLPRVIPYTWRLHTRTIDGARYVQPMTDLTVTVSGDVEHDEKKWIHLSIAHPERMPTWEEVVAAKEWIIGRDEYAVQVIPPRERYVNTHPFCLHLFSCVDGHPLPDFTRGGNTL